MKIRSKDFRVPEGDAVNLKKWPTAVKPVYKSKKHYKDRLEEHVSQLSALKQLHYASGQYAVLLIFQAMNDTLEGLNMSYPKTNPERRKELEAIRHELTS